MIKITSDVNVLVSGSFWTGESFRILEFVELGKIGNITSHEIIADYIETCESEEIMEKMEKYNLTRLKTAEKITSMSLLVHPEQKLKVVKDDPDDDKIIEAAIEGCADYILSYDNHLLKIKEYEGIKIVTPKQFLDLLRK